MADIVRIINLVDGIHSLDAKLDEDRVVRHTYKALNEVLELTGQATLDETKRNAELARAEALGKIRIEGESDPLTLANRTLAWTFQTNSARQYAGGFYDFPAADNDFSPALNFGVANVAVAAHFSIVTGALASTAIQIQVTGDSIDDEGNQISGDTQVINIPEGTPANSYFETPKKWNGQIAVETISGTPVACNYGWTKYHDLGNHRFIVRGLEALWESDATDSGSDITLLHHRSTGWTFNAGAQPTFPSPAAQRSADHPGNNTHRVGQGAWKRTDLNVDVRGDDGEGILFCIDSGSTGLGSLSFRLLTLEVSVRETHQD